MVRDVARRILVRGGLSNFRRRGLIEMVRINFLLPKGLLRAERDCHQCQCQNYCLNELLLLLAKISMAISRAFQLPRLFSFYVSEKSGN